MLRRTKTEDPTLDQPAGDQSDQTPQGKGRPTPKRREAEAAAKARAKVPRTRKELAAAQRSARGESSRTVRAGMKAGDERYLLPRDKGPVRRFIRDFVDSRISFIELIIPILLITMVLGYSGNDTAERLSSTVLLATVLLVVVEMVGLRFRLRKQLAQRFPDEPTKGTTYYAVTRAMQMKFMRIPKAKVKIGQDLPETYR